MNNLLIEVLQWLQNNQYRRASFDRLCGIIPSAATYEQLSQLVRSNPTIFRATVIKGGMPGLAVQDNIYIPTTLASLAPPPVEGAPMTIGYGNTPSPVPVDAPAAPTYRYESTMGDVKEVGVFPYNETIPAPAPTFVPDITPVAPTVTENAVEAEIVNEYYRNLGSALKVPNGPVGNVTLCVLELRNGFVIIGKSACVNAANFNADTGQRLAREDAVKQVWPFLGFRLADTRMSEPQF
jgi:hypothetical protein